MGRCDLLSLGADTISIESVISKALTKDIGLRRVSLDVGVVGVAIVAFRFTCGDWCGGKTGTPPLIAGWYAALGALAYNCCVGLVGLER